METSKVARGPFLVDAHVHFYTCYDRDAFFDGAVSNFELCARGLGLPVGNLGFLLFCETAEDHYFQQFDDEAGRESTEYWTFNRTAESCSLIARRKGNDKLVLVAGKQIATKEGLEVLALGYSGEFPVRPSLENALHAVRECGAIAVLPWGFGKWWFRRGALVSLVLGSAKAGQLFVGDNRGRLSLARRPRLFDLAESRGILILPGSDPLPFSTEATKAGSYGFVLNGDVDLSRPAESLKRLLLSPSRQPETYGQLQKLFFFCRNQLAMQLRKRRRSWQRIASRQ